MSSWNQLSWGMIKHVVRLSVSPMIIGPQTVSRIVIIVRKHFSYTYAYVDKIWRSVKIIYTFYELITQFSTDFSFLQYFSIRPRKPEKDVKRRKYFDHCILSSFVFVFLIRKRIPELPPIYRLKPLFVPRTIQSDQQKKNKTQDTAYYASIFTRIWNR